MSFLLRTFRRTGGAISDVRCRRLFASFVLTEFIHHAQCSFLNLDMAWNWLRRGCVVERLGQLALVSQLKCAFRLNGKHGFLVPWVCGEWDFKHLRDEFTITPAALSESEDQLPVGVGFSRVFLCDAVVHDDSHFANARVFLSGNAQDRAAIG